MFRKFGFRKIVFRKVGVSKIRVSKIRVSKNRAQFRKDMFRKVVFRKIVLRKGGVPYVLIADSAIFLNKQKNESTFNVCAIIVEEFFKIKKLTKFDLFKMFSKSQKAPYDATTL